MSRQRRRGQPVQIWPRKLTVDGRGNSQYHIDLDDTPYEFLAAVIPQRSSKAEVPGQQQIDVVRLILPPDADKNGDVGLWGRVHYNGDAWDIAAPPSYHHGTRGTRHWSMDIRRRP